MGECESFFEEERSRAAGSRVVFVVDSSNSMKNGRFRSAADELLRSVKSLSMQMKGNTVPIHTIGFRATDRGEDLLRAISEKHHGTHTDIE